MGTWVVVGVVVWAIVLTVGSNWLAAGFRRPSWPDRVSWPLVKAVAASLIWMLLLIAAGIVAVRYSERLSTAAGKALLLIVVGLIALVLCVLRARLYRQVESAPTGGPVTWPVAAIVHTLAYLLLATVVYLILALLLRQPARPILWIPLWLGALLPDLDSQHSALGRLLPFLSHRLEARFGHRGEWHTLPAALLVGVVTLPIALVWGVGAWYPIPLGYASHLALDLFSPQGILLLWPANRVRYTLLHSPIRYSGSATERWLAAGLVVMAAVLLVAVDLNQNPAEVAALPSYEQSISQFYALRGRRLAYADIDGTWQATGRPVTAWFEIVSGEGQTLILIDRYTGRILSAGRDVNVDVHLNRIRVVAGPAVQVKAIEVPLNNQSLADLLDPIYQMQQEPGLQHILISGQIVVPGSTQESQPSLRADLTQTGVPKIQVEGDGQYRLQYLTAAELIALANVQVSNGDLVVVATYVSPAAGPTATPLPSPPPPSEPVQ